MVTRRTALAGVTGLLTLSAGCLSDLGINSDNESDDDSTGPDDSDDSDDSDETNESETPADDEGDDTADDGEHEQVDGAYELTVAEIEEGDWIGEQVRIEGTVTDTVGGDTVDRFALEDDTGELRMVYPVDSRDDFGTGDTVRVEGVVTDGEDVPSNPPVIEEAEVYYL